MDKIEELLKDPKTDLQKQALTDKSYKNKTTHSQNNDEINFELATYGDAVLKLALCKVYRDKKNAGIKFSDNLSQWKEKHESDEVLVRVIAKHYNLLNFLRYDEKGNGKPEEQKPQDYDHKGQNDKDRHKYLATAMEACIAAVYIENGENEVIEIVKQWIEWIDKVTNSSDT